MLQAAFTFPRSSGERENVIDVTGALHGSSITKREYRIDRDLRAFSAVRNGSVSFMRLVWSARGGYLQSLVMCTI